MNINRLQQKLLAASTACVSADGRITVDEAEALRAVAEPFSERHFRAGLCTTLIGLTAESLEALLADGPQKESRHARFRSWRETWASWTSAS